MIDKQGLMTKLYWMCFYNQSEMFILDGLPWCQWAQLILTFVLFLVIAVKKEKVSEVSTLIRPDSFSVVQLK